MNILKRILIALFLLNISLIANSQEVIVEKLPVNFLYHRDEFIQTLHEEWEDVTIPSALAGQIEQETCVSLTSKKCWSTHAELKTSREYGFGLGQITVTSKFNNFEEIKQKNSKLKDWKWEQRYDSKRQMISLFTQMKINYNQFKNAGSEKDRFAFSLAAYNGGLGGVFSDQRICLNTKGCNPRLWFNNVENTSLKAKTTANGYGKSFFQINREYPVNILDKRRFKYKDIVDFSFDNVQM